MKLGDRFKPVTCVSQAFDKDKYRHTSIAKFEMRLLNASVIKVYGYDKVADFLYRHCKENDTVVICGRLDGNMKVEVISLYYVWNYPLFS